jgi:two-component system, cell cycle response regulator
MVYLLSAFGHEAIQAHDGEEGIETARREHPDLVLLDIHMPRMDGYEVANHLRKDADFRKTPLVAVTALAMVGDREKILNAGFDGYIAKPVDPEKFSTEVQRYLRAPAKTSITPPLTERVPPQAGSCKHSTNTKLALVLFVDNTQTNIDLVRSILEPSGYEVVAARSAGDGLRAAQQRIPDLIVSDVHMPQLDGYDFMRMVQEDASLSKVPFVFLSSSVWSLQEQQRALLRGARKFISRPIEPEALLSELRACLQKE